MPQTCLLQIFLRGRVTALRFLRHQPLCLDGRHAQIKDEVFVRKTINSVFQVLDPLHERGAPFRPHTRGLMRQIRRDITVRENNLALVQRGFQSRLGLVTIPGIKERRKVRIHALEGAEFAVQKLPDHFSEPGTVLRKARRVDGMALRAQRGGQEFDLRALAAAIDAFDGDQFSANCHDVVTVYPETLDGSLTGESPHCNATRGNTQAACHSAWSEETDLNLTTQIQGKHATSQTYVHLLFAAFLLLTVTCKPWRSRPLERIFLGFRRESRPPRIVLGAAPRTSPSSASRRAIRPSPSRKLSRRACGTLARTVCRSGK